jgi:hypothetical protein
LTPTNFVEPVSASIAPRRILAAIILSLVPLLVAAPAQATPSATQTEVRAEDVEIQVCRTTPLPIAASQSYTCGLAFFYFVYKYYRDTRVDATHYRRCYYFDGYYYGCGGVSSLGTKSACKIIP